MIKGYVFDGQEFPAEAFAFFENTFLDGNEGIARDCEITNTSNSITIGEGWFLVQGRLMRIISSETVNVESLISGEEFCKLVLEIDLSKLNTEEVLNQVSLKVLTNATTYPTLTKEDLFNGGIIYQFEFCQFKNTISGITDLVDTRVFLDFDSIYAYISKEIENLKMGAEAEFEETKVKLENDFNIWFETMKNILDEETATNLYHLIEELNTRVTTVEQEVIGAMGGEY